jgi:hypothetical protein
MEAGKTYRWNTHYWLITSAGNNTWRNKGEITRFICFLNTINNCRGTSMSRSTVRGHCTVKKCSIRVGTFSNPWWSKLGLPTFEEQKSERTNRTSRPNGWHSCLVFLRPRVRISFRRPVILTEASRNFPQSIQVIAGIVSWIIPRPLPCISFPIH